MNTPASNDDNDLRCAEYALGVLDAGERSALEQAVARDAGLRRTLDQWQQRLAPLAEDVAAVVPPGRVWTRVQRDLGFLDVSSLQPTRGRQGWWDSLNLWRWLAIGASVAALALLAVNLVWVRETPRPASVVAGNGYLVATIARADGVAHWTATVDVRRAQMVVVPAVHPTVAADRATELWLIPHDAKPIALGVIPPDAPATMSLPPELVARMGSGAVLAVSIEPPGGSPTGAPTGPVVATGAIHAT